MVKPDPKTAMENLIREARKRLPFGMSFDGHCEGRCDECPEKLLEFLDMTLCDWEARLRNGIAPTLGELHELGRECREVHDILQKKGVPGVS